PRVPAWRRSRRGSPARLRRDAGTAKSSRSVFVTSWQTGSCSAATPTELRRSNPLELGRNLFGLSAQAKARLIDKLSSASSARPAAHPARRSARDPADAAAERLDPSELEGFREIRLIREAADFLGITDP